MLSCPSGHHASARVTARKSCQTRTRSTRDRDYARKSCASPTTKSMKTVRKFCSTSHTENKNGLQQQTTWAREQCCNLTPFDDYSTGVLCHPSGSTRQALLHGRPVEISLDHGRPHAVTTTFERNPSCNFGEPTQQTQGTGTWCA